MYNRRAADDRLTLPMTALMDVVFALNAFFLVVFAALSVGGGGPAPVGVKRILTPQPEGETNCQLVIQMFREHGVTMCAVMGAQHRDALLSIKSYVAANPSCSLASVWDLARQRRERLTPVGLDEVSSLLKSSVRGAGVQEGADVKLVVRAEYDVPYVDVLRVLTCLDELRPEWQPIYSLLVGPVLGLNGLFSSDVLEVRFVRNLSERTVEAVRTPDSLRGRRAGG